MRPLTEFATTDCPLHPSGLSTLVACPWRHVMLFLAPGTDEGGEAADTGSAMHRAAEALHKEGKEVAECIDVMREHVHLYPRAELMDAANLFLKYATHPELAQREVVLCEEPIRFEIAPAPEDPTGAPISIIGETDQVVRRNSRLEAWDIKTTKKPPLTALRNSQMQLAAYCIGASFLLQERVHPGGLIMPRAPVMFVPVTWRFEDIELILAPVRHVVARIRAGDVWHHSSSYNCDWCHAGGPELCVPRMRRTLL